MAAPTFRAIRILISTITFRCPLVGHHDSFQPNHSSHKSGHAMYLFVLRDYQEGVLMSLPSVIKRVPCDKVTHWRFRDITVNEGLPFGIPAPLLEERSRISPDGVCVSTEEFGEFLKTDIQIIDGCIYALSGANARTSLFCLDCVDASQWEATTEYESIANELEKHGWSRQ